MLTKSTAASFGGLIAGGLMLCTTSTPSAALVIYDTFGPGDSYNPNIGWGVSNFATPSMSFWTSVGGLFSKLTIAVGNEFDSSLALYLQANDGGKPGTVLEKLFFHVLTRFGDGGGVYTAEALGTTLLSAGNYWLTASSPSDYGWYFNNIGAVGYVGNLQGPFVEGLYGGSTSVQTLSAFRVEVADPVEPDSVPEPGTLALFGVGLIALAGFRRRALNK